MLVVCATALKKIRVVAFSVKVFNAIVTNSRAWQHSKPSKGIFSAYISFLISHVPPKLDIWFRKNVLSSTKCTLLRRFVPRKRFRRNKSRNHTVPQGVVIQTYVGFHSPTITVFVHHVGRFSLTTSGGTRPRPVSGDIDIQLVAKQSVET